MFIVLGSTERIRSTFAGSISSPLRLITCPKYAAEVANSTRVELLAQLRESFPAGGALHDPYYITVSPDVPSMCRMPTAAEVLTLSGVDLYRQCILRNLQFICPDRYASRASDR